LSSVTGGGECLRLLEIVKLLVSLSSSSAVPGGVGSREGWKDAVFTDVVRRCRVRYEVDRGNSGLLDTVGPDACPG
jgi:hypothetical protein